MKGSWSTALQASAAASVLVLCGLLYSSLPPSPDQWLLDYTGWMITRGAVPYVTFVDGNWPAGHWLHALSVWLFGTTLYAWRIFDFLLMTGCAIAGAHLVRLLWGRAAGLWMLFLYPCLYIVNGPWFAGERDLAAANVQLIVLGAYWQGITTRRLRWQIVAGLGVAFCGLIKPTFLLLGGVLVLHAAIGAVCGRWSVRDAVAHVATAGAASLAGLALGFGALALQGASLESFFDAAVRSVTVRYGNDVSGISESVRHLVEAYRVSWHWIGAGGAASLAFHLRVGGRKDLPINILFPVVWAAGAASYFAQGQALYYTLGPMWAATVPILCGGLGAATDGIHTSRGWRRAALILCLALTVGLTGKKLLGAYEGSLRWWSGQLTDEEYYARWLVGDGIDVATALALSAELSQRVDPGSTILVWGRANAINVLAQRPQPTRFHHFVTVARSYLPVDIAERWNRWFEEDLEKNKPSYCLVNPEFLEGASEPRPRATLFLEGYLRDNYTPIRKVGPSTLYERREPSRQDPQRPR